MKRFLRIALVCLILPMGTSAGQDAGALHDVVARAQQDVDTLAAPSLFGRGYTNDGHIRAAAYLEGQFRDIGLEPVNGAYLQAFPLEADVFPVEPVLVVDGRPLEAGIEFLPYPSSPSGSAPESAALYAGYGLVLPEAGRDDYAGLDVAGQVVVIDQDIPDSVRTLAAENPDLLAVPFRIETAARKGARAVVLRANRLIFGAVPVDLRIPTFTALRPAWPDPGASVSYSVRSLQNQPVLASNVIGRLPGSAVPDSVILLMAHYDHLGSLGDSLYFPGANDNASGVALLLALARHFEAHPLPYSLVFVAFSGEESGLLGSRYFIEHPLINLSHVRFLLNFDMVASGKDGVVALGGVEFEPEYALLSAINDELGIGPLSKRANAPNSDHYFFLASGLSGFYLYTKNGTQPYHSPNDVPATLEWDLFANVYELVRRFIQRLPG